MNLLWGEKLEMEKILLIGANGQVGSELFNKLDPIYDVRTSTRKGGDFPLDLEDIGELRTLVGKVRPKVIINTAAYTAVDKAESESERAFAINAVAPEKIAIACKEFGAALVHFSTDYVYGSNGSGYLSESDTASPFGVYGTSKLRGEEAVLAQKIPFWIIRTSWVYGACGHNFVKTMLKLGQNHEELSVVNDQYGAPTSASSIADTVCQMLAFQGRSPFENIRRLTGIYNVVNSSCTNWYGFANAIFDLARSNGFPFEVKRIKSVTSVEYPTPAPRQKNSRLSLDKLERDFSIKPEHWKVSLQNSFKDILSSLS